MDGQPPPPVPTGHLLVQAELSDEPIGPDADLDRNVGALQSNSQEVRS